MKKYLSFLFAVVFILTSSIVVFPVSAEETLPTNEDIINEKVSAETVTETIKEPMVEEMQEEKFNRHRKLYRIISGQQYVSA